MKAGIRRNIVPGLLPVLRTYLLDVHMYMLVLLLFLFEILFIFYCNSKNHDITGFSVRFLICHYLDYFNRLV